jgi:hypothetical protein
MSNAKEARAALDCARDRCRSLTTMAYDIIHDLAGLHDMIVAGKLAIDREKAVRKTRVKSVPKTKALGLKIRSYAFRHPNASNQEIGNHFKVNTGRVSEALHSKF